MRNAKGGKDRIVPLQEKAAAARSGHLERVKTLHEADLAEGFGEVYLPDALARKYPHAAKDRRRQYVFPSARLSADPGSGAVRRHHLHENGLQKAVNLAAELVQFGIAGRTVRGDLVPVRRPAERGPFLLQALVALDRPGFLFCEPETSSTLSTSGPLIRTASAVGDRPRGGSGAALHSGSKITPDRLPRMATPATPGRPGTDYRHQSIRVECTRAS